MIRGRALQYLRSSGTNVFMNGPLRRKLCGGENRDNTNNKKTERFYLKQTSIITAVTYEMTCLNKQRLYPCRPRPVDDPLPFIIIYTNIVDLWLHRHYVDVTTCTNTGVYFKW